MISLVDMRPAWRRPAGAQQRPLPLRPKRLAKIIDPAKNLDDPIQHHRLHYSAMAAYLKKLFSHNPLVARKPLIRVIESLEGRVRARTRHEAIRFRVAIRVLLLNLFAAWSIHPATRLGVSLDANAYS